jgi:hypothetical protein
MGEQKSRAAVNEPIGLCDLIEAAQPRDGFDVRWHDTEPDDWADAVGDAVVARARCGAFFQLRVPTFRLVEGATSASKIDIEGAILRLRDSLVWGEFASVCNIAERIDAFLAVFERDRASAPLARRCRDDLDALLILADWCEENDLPMAAREARHFDDLVRYLRRDLFP